jgi:hypothetical protein
MATFCMSTSLRVLPRQSYADKVIELLAIMFDEVYVVLVNPASQVSVPNCPTQVMYASKLLLVELETRGVILTPDR